MWRRDSRLKGLFIFLFFISGVALWHQLTFQSALRAARVKAQQDSRQEWLTQELKHPHMAAHFGNYAYKKPLALHCFDPGITIYTGTSVYMEPHRQNDFLFSKSGESDTGLRFGWLSPAMICLLILPLLIILVTFNSVNGEYEKGTLSLLLSQGISLRQLLAAKTLSVFLFFEAFLTLYLGITAIIASQAMVAAIDFSALAYLWMNYSLYCLIWSLSGVYVSSRIKNAGGAIAVLLLLWMLTNIIVPRVSANVAGNIHPLITNYEFKKQVAESIEKGLDGHDSKSERAVKIEKELLANHKVDSVQQLPFNFEGLIMQQSEDYSSQVYDFYFGKVFETLQKQKKVQAAFGIISPYVSLRNVSMAASHAGLESEIDFQQQSENYRRSFVQNMNNDMRDNSAYGTFETYRVKTDKYASIADVEVANRPLKWLLSNVIMEISFLSIWLVILLMLLFKNKRKPFYS